MQALQPSKQTEFGVYAHIGNNFGYTIGEDWLPLTTWQQRPDGEFERQGDQQRIVLRKKQAVTFTTRAALMGGDGGVVDLEKGRVLEYKIERKTEADREFTNNSYQGQPEAKVQCSDVASSISSLQRGFDENINVGDLYKIGSALAICIDRTDDPFISDHDFDGDGVSVTAKFKIIQEGKCNLWNEAAITKNKSSQKDGTYASTHGQIFRLAMGGFSIERAAQVIEVGLRSAVGLKSSNIAHFNSLEKGDDKRGDDGIPDDSYQAWVDAEYVGGVEGGPQRPMEEAYRVEVTPGKYSAADVRYSFFRIEYRDIAKKA